MKLTAPKPNFANLANKAKGIVSALRAKLPAKLGGTDGAAHGAKPAAASPPDADIPDRPKPTFLKRNAHLMPPAGAYAAFFILLLGIGLYLVLNEEKILAERRALDPPTRLTAFDVIRRNPVAGEESADGMATEPSETAGTTPPPSGSETQAEAQTATADTQPPPQPVDAPDPYAGNLAPHPDPDLTEQVEALGQLPRIGDDDRLPWKVYARPSSSLETRPRIAVVILDLGLSESITERAIRLPGVVTLAFSAYARGLDGWISRARDAGHEVMVGLPMEPRDFPRSDAGLLQLQTSYEAERNLLNLHRVMSETSGYIGLVNYQGSGFTASRTSVRPIMQDLAKRGLVYFDTLENATSVAPEEAAKASAPATTADLYVDQSMSRPVVTARLSQMELLAKSRASAVVAVQPFPMLIDRVGTWTRGLGEKSMVPTPLSGVIMARLRDGQTG